MVELIDHHVVESVRRESVQVAGEGLHAGKEHAGVRLLGACVVQPDIGAGLHATEDVD